MRSNDWSNTEAVERWLSARPTRNPVVEYLRDGFDFGDIFGSTMACMFAIGDVLTEFGNGAPADWNFRQALGGSDTDSWEYRAICEALQDGKATLDDVERAATVFERLDRMNRLTGKEY